MKLDTLKIVVILLLVSCTKNSETYSNLEALTGKGVIKIGSHNVAGPIGEIFLKYIYVTAPNGKRIEIFGTAKVTDKQMVYARDILNQYLTISGKVYGSKKYVANSMANKKAALVFWDSEEQYEDNMIKLAFTGYNLQDLYATESIDSGNRDASYEEILHLVHNYGIAPTAPLFQKRLQQANDDAIAKGLWIPRSGADDLPEADFDDEYFAAIVDCYLDLWKGKGGTMGGAYKPSSRAEMQKQDPVGYQLVVDMFEGIKLIK